MAAKIVLFPAGHKSNEVDRLIRKWLAELSADTDLIHCVAERMKAFIDNYASKTFEPTFNLSVPSHITEKEAEALLISIEKGVDNTAEQVQEMINRIIVERFFLEIEIYEMQKTGKRNRFLSLI